MAGNHKYISYLCSFFFGLYLKKKKPVFYSPYLILFFICWFVLSCKLLALGYRWPIACCTAQCWSLGLGIWTHHCRWWTQSWLLRCFLQSCGSARSPQHEMMLGASEIVSYTLYAVGEIRNNVDKYMCGGLGEHLGCWCGWILPKMMKNLCLFF